MTNNERVVRVVVRVRLRAAFRRRYVPGLRFHGLGFRPAFRLKRIKED